jgi:phage baseplate assembly protein W
MPIDGPPVLDPPPVVQVGSVLPASGGVEILVPFNFKQGGGVSTTNDPDTQVRQHVDALMRTIPGERVMKPTYGVSLLPYVFDNISPAEVAAMQQLIADGFNDWIPTAQLKALTGVVGPSQGVSPDTVIITVQYTRRADPMQSTTTADIPVVSM